MKVTKFKCVFDNSSSTREPIIKYTFIDWQILRWKWLQTAQWANVTSESLIFLIYQSTRFYRILKSIAVNQRVDKGDWPGFTGRWVVIGVLVSVMKCQGLV